MLNIQFAQSAARLHLDSRFESVASLAFIAATVLMPVCCLLLAARRRHFEIFAAPIVCLATGLILTVGGLVQ